MGRRIYEEDNFVYKYVFGVQPSEQGRIYVDYNIGKLYLDCYDQDKEEFNAVLLDNVVEDDWGKSNSDILELNIKDRDKLADILKLNEFKDFDKAKEYYYNEIELHSNENKGIPFEQMNVIIEKSLEICDEMFFGLLIETFIKYMDYFYELKNKEIFTFRGDF